MSSQEAKTKLAQLLAELKADYLQTFPQKLQSLRELTAQRDWAGLESQYHKLKGTGKTYGFPEVSLVCQILEEMAHSPGGQKPEIFEEALTLLEKLHQCYLQQQPPRLEEDSFWRSLLALKLK